MSASRGELRTPLPTRSVRRTASTCQGCVARAKSRSRGAGDRVAEEHERLSALRVVRDHPRCELEQTRDRVRRAFDETEIRRPGAERLHQEDGEEREDHLRPDVRKEAREAEENHRGR